MGFLIDIFIRPSTPRSGPARPAHTRPRPGPSPMCLIFVQPWPGPGPQNVGPGPARSEKNRRGLARNTGWAGLGPKARPVKGTSILSTALYVTKTTQMIYIMICPPTYGSGYCRYLRNGIRREHACNARVEEGRTRADLGQCLLDRPGRRGQLGANGSVSSGLSRVRLGLVVRRY